MSFYSGKLFSTRGRHWLQFSRVLFHTQLRTRVTVLVTSQVLIVLYLSPHSVLLWKSLCSAAVTSSTPCTQQAVSLPTNLYTDPQRWSASRSSVNALLSLVLSRLLSAGYPGLRVSAVAVNSRSFV